MSIKATYQPNTTVNTPTLQKQKEFRIRAVKSAGKLSRAKPKISKYVLRNLIKFKDREVFPQKYELQKVKSPKKELYRPKIDQKKIAQVHFTKLKNFLEYQENQRQNETLIYIQQSPSQQSVEDGTSYELSRNNSIGMTPLSPTLYQNGSQSAIAYKESRSPETEKRVWLSKFSKNTRRILTAQISKCLLHRKKVTADDWDAAVGGQSLMKIK